MNVDDYIQNAPETRRPALTALRELLLATLDGYTETMRYNMPSYERNGEVEIAFASNKQHIAFYLLKEPVLDEYRDRFPKSRIGKGCVRFSSPKQIDLSLIERMARDSVASDAPIC
jgi:uncharacterized protein YdhG (YjbR/CyaY superfamily)